MSTWSANATLNALASPTGAVVVWRGLRGGQEATVAAEVSLDGKVSGEPYAVGAAACATASSLAWVDHGPKGTWLVKTRAFATPEVAVGLTLPEDRDPAMLCGVHNVFALGDGDDDVVLNVLGAAAHPPPVRVLVDAEFKGDEERGHEAYAVGDDLGFVRFGLGGASRRARSLAVKLHRGAASARSSSRGRRRARRRRREERGRRVHARAGCERRHGREHSRGARLGARWVGRWLEERELPSRAG